jgi:hypothetical protein
MAHLALNGVEDGAAFEEDQAMKTILLSAAASLMMLSGASAMGLGGVGNPFDGAGTQSRFIVNIPTVDTGSQAYPSTLGSGSNGAVITHGLRFNPALLHSPDTGSQQMPVGLR